VKEDHKEEDHWAKGKTEGGAVGGPPDDVTLKKVASNRLAHSVRFDRGEE